MVCLLCGKKVRWWESSVSSVINVNRYHWACWDAGGTHYQKRNGKSEAFSASQTHQLPAYPYPSHLTVNGPKGGRTRGLRRSLAR